MSQINAIKIHKVYSNGEDWGHYIWKTEKVQLTEHQLFNYELSCPLMKGINTIITMGVPLCSLDDYWGNINPLATELFNQHISGECVITFDDYNEKQFNIVAEVIKQKLIQLGVPERFILY
jgi:hypothetical protein